MSETRKGLTSSERADGARAERIGLSEAFRRQLNGRLEQLAQKLDLDRDELDLVCEMRRCALCRRIRVPRGQYQTLRANPHHFAVRAGHANPPRRRPLFWL